MRKIVFLLLLSFLFIQPVFSEELKAVSQNHFLAGNELYGKKQYQEAITSYEEALREDGELSEIYFNIGVSYLNLKKIGNAKVSFLRALKADPENKDVKAILKDVDNKIELKIANKMNFYRGFFYDRLNIFSATEYLFALFGLIAIFSAMLFLSLLLPKMKIFALFRNLFVVLAFVVGVVYFGKPYIALGKPAVVIQSEAHMRSGPSLEDPNILKLEEGVEVYIVDPRSEWTRIALQNNETGWVQAQSIQAV